MSKVRRDRVKGRAGREREEGRSTGADWALRN